ncbi:MAG: response regulator transcription factor, partial [Acidobacteria bacterium]|nr:response regulator transcription factor [Acidobacteriota bacterium]
MAHILVIEDEPSVCIALQDTLESEGHSFEIATDGNSGLNLAGKRNSSKSFDLILLDLMLPKMSGLEVCQQLREDDVSTPIIMLTARGEPSDAAFGLKLGADDYVSKPFEVGELLARIDAVLRRSGKSAGEDRTAMIGDIRFDFLRLKAKKNETELDITPREFEILGLLFANAGETVSREQLLNHIWGENAS